MSGGQDEASEKIDSSGGKLPIGLREIEMTEAATKQIEDMLAAEPTQPIVEPRDMRELHSVEWAKEVFELQRLLKVCDGNPVLALQLKSRLEELNPYPTWGQENDVRGVSNFQAEIERELCEGMDELVDTLKKENDATKQIEMLDPAWGKIRTNWPSKTENDVMERDTRGPAIVSVGSVNTGLKFYGPFVSIEDAVAWLHDCNLTGATTVSLLETPPKANIRSPKYEPHTMESLLPLAGEWVHYRDDASQVIQFSKITLYDGVVLGGICRSYKRLADDWIWATGPHKGKPVAREVG